MVKNWQIVRRYGDSGSDDDGDDDRSIISIYLCRWVIELESMPSLLPVGLAYILNTENGQGKIVM